MKKKSVSLLVFLAVILGACSSPDNDLEGEVLNVFTWDPTISSEDISENLNPSSNLEFDFKSSDKVEVKLVGEIFKGVYTLDGSVLSVDLKDENNEEALAMEFEDFNQHEENASLYTGTISKLDIKNDAYHRIGSNFSLNEYLGFYNPE
ncbi:hypothetical protein FO441_03785 [Salinicoccus cyprini]|uniref:Lipoprotein n=1 Tax=Salinicoccus cyprini TaxID=2493691 RepID=A0A558AYU8_9STAP|nr:hypothetical protein [Salinicoccus cyprini]TVT29414.1 hypothetical protein FO441_03785 [Salinicoccus cyprini]